VTADDTATVLIVDDHRVLSEAVAGLLRAHNCDVVVAASFELDELVAMVARLGRVVVLLDLHLGEALSIPLVEPLTASGGRVIVLTADHDVKLLGRALVEGAVAVLSKEIPFADIVFSIHQVWNGEPAMGKASREALLAAGRQAEREERHRLAPFEALTPRERVVLRHLIGGRSPKEIARLESVSVATVRSQLRSMFDTLGVGSQREAISRAHTAGWS
jgi:two-component system, NarL family, nitrate/nitrite response regulator NarL